MRNVLKRLGVFLVCASMTATSVSMAAGTEVGTSGNGGTVPVEITAEAALFSVTIPTTLPININSAGVVTVADSAAIANNSSGPVKVTGVEIGGANGWSIVAPGKDYLNSEMGLKEVGITLNGDATSDAGTITTTPENWPTIQAKSSQPVVYSANVPPQGSALTQQVASVVFKVDWAAVAPAPAPEPEPTPTPAPTPAPTKVGMIRRDDSGSKPGLDTVAYNATKLSFVSTPYSEMNVGADTTAVDISELGDGSVMALTTGTEVVVCPNNPDNKLYAPESGEWMFASYKATEIDVSNLDTSRTTSFSQMFNRCTSLKAIHGLENFNTSSVTSMYGMFNSCGKLTSLAGVENWDTSNVANMGNMFFSTYGVTTNLDLSRWNVEKVTTMNGMFSSFSAELNISGWNTPSLTNVNTMFRWAACTTLDLSSMDFSNVTTADSFLTAAPNLTSVKMPATGMPVLGTASSMFSGSSKIAEIDLRGVAAAQADSTAAVSSMLRGLTTTSIIVNSQADKDWIVANAAAYGFDAAYADSIKVLPK